MHVEYVITTAKLVKLIFCLTKLFEICTAVHGTEENQFLTVYFIVNIFLGSQAYLKPIEREQSSLLLWTVRSSYVIYVNSD